MDQKHELCNACPSKIFSVNEQTGEIVVENEEAYAYDGEVEKKAEAMG